MAAALGVPMGQAMTEYHRGNHDRAFELLYPLRYKIVGIGGSDAQVRSEVITDGTEAWSGWEPVEKVLRVKGAPAASIMRACVCVMAAFVVHLLCTQRWKQVFFFQGVSTTVCRGMSSVS